MSPPFPGWGGGGGRGFTLTGALQVLKRSVEQSLSTKYVQTMTSNDRSTLRNFTRNFDADISDI